LGARAYSSNAAGASTRRAITDTNPLPDSDLITEYEKVPLRAAIVISPPDAASMVIASAWRAGRPMGFTASGLSFTKLAKRGLSLGPIRLSTSISPLTSASSRSLSTGSLGKAILSSGGECHAPSASMEAKWGSCARAPSLSLTSALRSGTNNAGSMANRHTPTGHR